MARHLFPPEVFLLTSAAPAATLAVNAPFRVFSDDVGGDEWTSLLTGPDGITPLAQDSTGKPILNTAGGRPWLRGPDTIGGQEITVMYCDTNTGARTPMYADDQMALVLLAGALLNVDQVWTGFQQFPSQSITIDMVTNLETRLQAAAASGGGGTGSLDPEAARDTIAAALQGTAQVLITPDDAADKINIALTSAFLAQVAAKFQLPTFTGNQGLIAFNREKSDGTYDPPPTDTGAMALMWVGTDDPVVGTGGPRTGDLRYRLP